MPLFFGLIGLDKVSKSPGFAAMRTVDAVQFLGCGACFGAVITGVIFAIVRPRRMAAVIKTERNQSLVVTTETILEDCNTPFLRRGWLKTLIVVFTASVIFTVLSRFGGFSKQQLFQVATIVAAITTTGLAAFQWRAARHETSFDKYYDRLERANTSFNVHSVHLKKDEPADPSGDLSKHPIARHNFTMFVFAELDNLEYALEKFKLGYIRRELVERAIRTFSSRCVENQSFREECTVWIGTDADNEGRAKGYHDTTRDAVRRIVTSLDTDRPS